MQAMRRFTTTPLLTGTGLLLGILIPLLWQASPTPAQERASDVELYAEATGGHLWGSDGLYRWSGVTGVTESATAGEYGGASLQSGPAGGLEAVARFPGLDMDAGLSVTRTIGLDGALTAGTFCRGLCLAAILPPDNHSFEADLTLLSAYLDLRTLPSVWRLQPFLSVGAGLKVYDFAVPTEVAETVEVLPKEENAATYRFGAGISVPFDRLEVVARITDFVSDYSPSRANTSTEPQHDLTATLGVRYRIWSSR